MDGVHVEVNFGGEPFVALLAEKGGDKAQQGGFVGEEGGDAGAAFEFLIDALDGVAGAHAPVMGGGEGVNGEALREVLLHPGSEFGSGFGIIGDALLEPCLGGGEIRGVEDGATGAQRRWPAMLSWFYAGKYFQPLPDASPVVGRRPGRFAGDGIGSAAMGRKGRRRGGRRPCRGGHR